MMYNVDIADSKKEQVCELVGNVQMTECMTEMNDVVCAEKGCVSEDNAVALECNGQGQQDALLGDSKRADVAERRTRHGDGEHYP